MRHGSPDAPGQRSACVARRAGSAPRRLSPHTPTQRAALRNATGPNAPDQRRFRAAARPSWPAAEPGAWPSAGCGRCGPVRAPCTCRHGPQPRCRVGIGHHHAVDCRPGACAGAGHQDTPEPRRHPSIENGRLLCPPPPQSPKPTAHSPQPALRHDSTPQPTSQLPPTNIRPVKGDGCADLSRWSARSRSATGRGSLAI